MKGFYANPSAKAELFPEDTEWIPRNPEMWQHGKMNFETPPNVLDREGFVTPQDLFFVRQHTAVPRLVPPGGSPDHHEFFVEQVIHGADGKQKQLKRLSISLGELKQKFEQQTLTAMMSCSGQRRYEMNLVDKTGGAISWHNSVGNGVWGGVWLRDVLLHFGVSMDHKISKFVELHGPQKEGYRSCIPFRKAMDPYGDCLLCWELNGEQLHPDHGQPLRLLVPGYSAKCSCKWLTGISVRDKDSDHGKHRAYYKLFPASLKPGTAEYDAHHKDPEYTIGELNVNSVIFEPHSCTSVASPGPLTITGYAHSGGGRPLARIEVSGNGGKTWEQVRPLRQELTDAGQLWSWVRFSHVLSHFDPSSADAELVVRAWDCAANTQPDWPNWNYTGMLNNHLYRVRVATTADCRSVFVHPTQWMNPLFNPFVANTASETVVLFDGNHQGTVSGGWKMGNFTDAIVHLNADKGSSMVVSDEPRFGGERLSATTCQGQDGELQLLAEFGGLSMMGTVCETSDGRHLLRWQNGMCWQKNDNKLADTDSSTEAGSELERVVP